MVNTRPRTISPSCCGGEQQRSNGADRLGSRGLPARSYCSAALRLTSSERTPIHWTMNKVLLAAVAAAAAAAVAERMAMERSAAVLSPKGSGEKIFQRRKIACQNRLEATRESGAYEERVATSARGTYKRRYGHAFDSVEATCSAASYHWLRHSASSLREH